MHSRLRKRTVERRTCRRNSKPYLTYRTKAQERTPRPFLQPSYASRLRSDLLGARASSRIRKATKTARWPECQIVFASPGRIRTPTFRSYFNHQTKRMGMFAANDAQRKSRTTVGYSRRTGGGPLTRCHLLIPA